MWILLNDVNECYAMNKFITFAYTINFKWISFFVCLHSAYTSWSVLNIQLGRMFWFRLLLLQVKINEGGGTQTLHRYVVQTYPNTNIIIVEKWIVMFNSKELEKF